MAAGEEAALSMPPQGRVLLAAAKLPLPTHCSECTNGRCLPGPPQARLCEPPLAVWRCKLRPPPPTLLSTAPAPTVNGPPPGSVKGPAHTANGPCSPGSSNSPARTGESGVARDPRRRTPGYHYHQC
ncbi:Hypothetical predicted protein [Marmota monax]|uniref:Uncharacterized protein n=1 Tax=Marmota monax TaxID=9995 RepID=A0A5E4AFQ1_MARMO|nr:Hypothetical predicted protein [Marmota monax]